MKKFLVLAVLLLCCSAAPSHQKFDREKDGLTGPVQSVQLLHGELDSTSGEWHVGELQLKDYKVYNRQGQIIEIQNFRHAMITTRRILSYDSMGRNNRIVGYSRNGKITSQQENTFNEQGDVVEELTYDSTSSQPNSRKTIFYDETGRKTNEVSWMKFPTTEIRSEWDYRYNEQGNLIEQILTANDDTVMTLSSTTDTVTTADNSAMRVRRITTVYMHNGKRSDRYIALYDSLDTLRSYQWYRSSPDHPDMITECNEKGLEYHILKLNDDGKWETEDIKFDDHDTPVIYYRSYYSGYPSHDAIPLRRDTTHVTIDYDMHGNWTHKRYTKRTWERGAAVDVPYMIETREITYFTE